MKTPLPAMTLLTATAVLFLWTSTISAQSADIEIRVNEEGPVGSFVVNVSHYPSLFLRVPAEDQHKLTFSMLDKTSEDASFFSINASTGVITMAKALDREAVCGGSDSAEDCAVTFSVLIRGTDGLTFSTIASVKVYVDDINDNDPTFPADQVMLEISEAAKVGYVLKLSGAQDLDYLPNNTIQRYEMTLSDPVFSVSSTRNPDGSTVLNLKLEKELDRENVSRYDFNVIAYDGGDPPRNDFLRVIIDVTDDNDNVPTFAQPSYTVSIREDTTAGEEIIKVSASDKDAGDFGTVRFRFSNLMPEPVRSLFKINSTSGSISLQSSTDLSSSDSPYSLVVEAFDGGDPPSVAQAVVTVNVLNTGNNPPVVRMVTESEGDSTEIMLPESAKVNDFVAFVNVEDNDEGRNGDVNCSLVHTVHFRLEKLLNKGYQVLLGLPVDREAVSTYDVTIVCHDGGSPSLSTETDFTVVITDVNDNDPRFDQPSYTASLAENNAEGQYLSQVIARDNDTDRNALITYGLLEDEATTYITIHPQTGVIRATMALDRETTPLLVFTLTAVDGGSNPRTGTARLTVTVRDVNDNAPQLLNLPYRFFVSEGASPGHVVAKMAAVDEDQGDNGEVEFFYAGSVTGEVPFTVHTNGTVVVSAVLDREESESHVFTVLARDKGAIPRSNSTQVTIKVSDINDNAPVILFPTNANHSVVISTAPEKGVTLGRVIAYDVDEGNASSLIYAIISGDARGVFDINPKTGEIYLDNPARLRNPFVYHVVLRVYDTGPNPRFAETRLQIDVNFRNVTHPGGTSGGQNGADDEKSRGDYVIIVGVIGGATLVLSGIIIGAILFVLKSERKRKPRDNVSVFKNDYVPAPTGVGIPTEKLESHIPKSPDVRSSHSDVSSSGVVLSPTSLAQKPSELPKKVSFSLDEQDFEGRPTQEMLLMPVSHPSSSSQDDPSMDRETAWKRVASPDDLNSDTSGDSGTCDSGRGASDDDIHHLDNSTDRHGVHHGGAPPLTNTNRTPARRAQANIYTPPGYSLYTFRPHERDDKNPNPGSHFTGGPAPTRPSTTPRPQFLHSGSYHEGRRDNTYHRGGKIQPPRRPDPHQRLRQQGPVVSLHPESVTSGSSMTLPPWGQSGDRHSMDHVDNRGGSWLPPRSASSLSYQRQTSGMSVEDDASTTTSGSYTISPDEIRLNGHGLNSDVIV